LKVCARSRYILQNPPARQVKQPSLPVVHTRRSRGPVFTARRPRLTLSSDVDPTKAQNQRLLRLVLARSEWPLGCRRLVSVSVPRFEGRLMQVLRLPGIECCGRPMLVGGMVFEGGLCAMSLRRWSESGARLSLTKTACTTRSQHLSTTQVKTRQYNTMGQDRRGFL
jgi:hypothetical protein